MAITASSVLPNNSLEDFRIEFNNLVVDVAAIKLVNKFDVSIIFEGDTADEFETTLSVVDPTADRSILLPNVSGNIIVDGNPISADGAALGSATLEWSDLYLADGGVIYFGDDQDIHLTHVADTGLRFDDSDKLMFGAGSDLQIWHDGSNSIISDAGTGSLFIRGSNITLSAGADGAETWATFVDNGAVTLYYDNGEKLATSSTGGTLTGTWNVTTNFVPDASDGAALGTTALEWSDLYLADGAVVGFGDDQDVTLTHVADTGLLLNSTMQLQFNDSSQYISGASATKLDIRATDEIELTSTLVDIVGALTVSGTTTLNGALVLGDAAADTLTVNATLQGASPLTFEGGTADGYETTFAITDPTADRTITFPNLTGTVSLITATETLTNKTLTAPTINGVIGGTQTSATITTLTTTTVNASAVSLGDDDVLTLGDSDELSLKHHNSGYSHLINTTGTLYIDSDSVTFRDDDGSPTNVLINQTGIDVTGTIQGTTITAETAVVPDASDGATLGTAALEWSDLYLADGGVIYFGDNQDVSLTHVAGTGIQLNGTLSILFNDASQYINAPNGTILDITATDEIELNATLVDINANVEISGTATTTGVHTFTAVPVLPANSIDSAHYVDGSIDTAHIAADAITAALIADDVINSEHYAAGSIDAEHMAANSIDSASYVDGSIDTAHYADDSITEAKMADDAIGLAQLKSGVTLVINDSAGDPLKTIYGAGA